MAIVMSKSLDSKSLNKKLLAASGGGLVMCTEGAETATTEHSEASSQLCSPPEPQQSFPFTSPWKFYVTLVNVTQKMYFRIKYKMCSDTLPLHGQNLPPCHDHCHLVGFPFH